MASFFIYKEQITVYPFIVGGGPHGEVSPVLMPSTLTECFVPSRVMVVWYIATLLYITNIEAVYLGFFKIENPNMLIKNPESLQTLSPTILLFLLLLLVDRTYLTTLKIRNNIKCRHVGNGLSNWCIDRIMLTILCFALWKSSFFITHNFFKKLCNYLMV